MSGAGQQNRYTGSCACGALLVNALLLRCSGLLAVLCIDACPIAGKVQLVARGEPVMQQYCHCHGCRQYHCAPFAATILFKASDFEIVGGETECFRVNNTPNCTRLSCKTCRSPVANLPTHFPQVRSTFPMLFKDFDFQPSSHIWWSHRVIDNDFGNLLKYDEWPPM